MPSLGGLYHISLLKKKEKKKEKKKHADITIAKYFSVITSGYTAILHLSAMSEKIDSIQLLPLR